MSKNRLKIEIYEGDPFGGCCGPGVASKDAVEKSRKMLMERYEIVKVLKEEFKEQIEIEREIVSGRRGYDSYPPHICKLLGASTQVPFIVIDGQLVLEGAFPSLEDFRKLISEHTKNSRQGLLDQ